MSGDIKDNVDTDSADFKLGAEAGLHSAVDSNNWQAGNELGRERKEEVANKEPVAEPSLPLFLSNSSEGKKGNAQDEKDETEE